MVNFLLLCILINQLIFKHMKNIVFIITVFIISFIIKNDLTAQKSDNTIYVEGGYLQWGVIRMIIIQMQNRPTLYV